VFEQSKLARNPRYAARIELLEMISGLLLVLFMWGHLIMLGTILFGESAMNRLAALLEKYYIAQAGGVGICFLLAVHFFTAGRKLPARLREQKLFWTLANKLRHVDTWLWLVQVVSGLAIGVFAAIHLWVILTTFPIDAAKSSERVARAFGVLYAPMVLVVELHVGIGLYRIYVKWTGLSRKAGAAVKWGLTGAFVVVGYWILATFWRNGLQYLQ
jgi:fumarate reductase subunit C